jgi:hypothetical protein
MAHLISGGSIMKKRLLAALVLHASVCLSTPVVAAPFMGTFEPSMYSDNNIFDGVNLTTGKGSVVVSAGAGSGLDLSLSFGSVSISVPLAVAGNVATLPSVYTAGGTTVLDVHLLSDGNNMAFDYVAKDAAGAISWIVSAWQQDPSLATASDALGHWVLTSAFENPNLRSSDFTSKSGAFDMVGSGSAYALQAGPIDVPLTIDQGRASLLSAPALAGSGYWQVLDMTYDNHGSGAFFFVGTERYDPTDVSITLGLATQSVPEPGTWAMLVTGLGLLGVQVRRKMGDR